MSEAGAYINKAAPLVTPTTLREGDGAIHLELLVDPAKDDRSNPCRGRLTAKSAKACEVGPSSREGNGEFWWMLLQNSSQVAAGVTGGVLGDLFWSAGNQDLATLSLIHI